MSKNTEGCGYKVDRKIANTDSGTACIKSERERKD